MDFSTDGARLWYESETKTIFLEGVMRLNTDAYKDMSKVLNDILATNPDTLTLDCTSLEFLNSSGINVIARFVIAVRNGKTVSLTVRGSKNIPWQGKSLPNLKKLYSAVKLVID